MTYECSYIEAVLKLGRLAFGVVLGGVVLEVLSWLLDPQSVD